MRQDATKPPFTYNETVCLATLAYYAVLSDAPLVASEVWQWQINDTGEPSHISLYDIMQSLDTLLQKNAMQEYNGFYSLACHNQPSYTQRIQAITHTAHKWSVIRKKARFLAYIPFVRYVRVIGSVALSTTHAKSDIDISIGSVRSHLWTTRAFTLFVAHILRRRRHHTKSNNRLCFNHYLGASGLQTNNEHLIAKTLFHISHQSLILWSKDQETTVPLIQKPRPILLSFKYAIERFLFRTKMDIVIEKWLSKIQIQHLNKHSLYSSELPPLSLQTQHLIFSYQKITDIEQRFQRQYTIVRSKDLDK